MRWSTAQEAIFAWFAGGEGNLLVRARAGAGKTTTIIEAAGRAPEAQTGGVLLAAFNKRIAAELAGRAPEGVEVKTLHALGFAYIRRAWKGVRVASPVWGRERRLADAVCTARTPDSVRRLVGQLCTVGRECAPLATTSEPLIDLAIARQICPDPGEATIEEIATLALAAMRRAAEVRDPEGIDFADMLYLPIACGWARPWFRLVIIDEAQDMGPAQLLLAQRACKRGGRIVVVGDDRQGIYAFRGADSGTIDRLREALSAAELPLTTTYRCGRTIVREAQQWVPDFESGPDNPEGEIRTVTAALLAPAEGDFVLSRTNAPLAGICLRLLREGKRARIEGKDLGRTLGALVRRLARKRTLTIADLSKAARTWRDREAARITAQIDDLDAADQAVEVVDDTLAVLRALSEGLTNSGELEARITALFSDTDETRGTWIVCSTVHRAKGLEADRVWVLRDTWRRAGLEEDNLRYVAATRAKRTLVYVSGDSDA